MLLLALLACAPTETEPAASFQRVQDELLTPSCAFSTCHSGSGGSAGLDLTEGNAYAAMVNVEAQDAPDRVLVYPGSAEASYLWQKCAGTDTIVGDPMPLGQEALDDERLALLTAWIDAGAIED